MTLIETPTEFLKTEENVLGKHSRILLLTASFGEGHNAAARGLRMALEERAHMSLGPSAETRLVDVCTEAYPRITSMIRRYYLRAMNHAPKVWGRLYDSLDANAALMRYLHRFSALHEVIKEEIDTFKPDAVVSTFPFYNQIIDAIYKNKDVPFLRFTVVTDSIRVNAAWARGKSDYHIVPNRPTLDALRTHGIPVANILDLGFPVSPKFANCQIERGNPPPWHVLYFPGGPWDRIEENMKMLVSLPKMELLVCAGRDRKLYRDLLRLKETIPLSFKLEGWIDDMPERLLSQHLVISKAGGAIVQECIAARCPMIISQVIPGQEEGNISLLKQQGVGAVAETAKELKTLMIRMMQGEAALWRSWKGNLLSLQRPLAGQTIARFILGRLAVRK